MKTIVIVGASSGIAKECAKLWLKSDPVHLYLVVRSSLTAKPLAVDLQIRSPSSLVEVLQADFMDTQSIKDLTRSIAAKTPIDIVLIAHGTLPDQQEAQESLDLCSRTLEINGVSPCLFAEAFASEMKNQARGSIAVIGSVAGDRGRKSNYIYGAAKDLVARYVEGMQHRFAKGPLTICLIKPGPTATPMTEHLQEAGAKMAPASLVARDIIEGVAKGSRVIYTPRKWQIIMLIIRHLPNFIFNKLNI
jgi:decaprenylphospho-beta-D-erythro-pentofuranosid-2-ulose 2-reductase